MQAPAGAYSSCICLARCSIAVTCVMCSLLSCGLDGLIGVPPLTLPRQPAGVLQSDSCRLQQLRCHTSRQGHLFNRFTWGNRSSLLDEPRKCGIDVRKDLVDYYRWAPP